MYLCSDVPQNLQYLVYLGALGLVLISQLFYACHAGGLGLTVSLAQTVPYTKNIMDG